MAEADSAVPAEGTAAGAAAATVAPALAPMPTGQRAAFVAERIALAEVMQQRALITEGDVSAVRERLVALGIGRELH